MREKSKNLLLPMPSSGPWTPAVCIRDFALCSWDVHIIFCAPSISKSWIRPCVDRLKKLELPTFAYRRARGYNDRDFQDMQDA